jgi:hypothetical protein
MEGVMDHPASAKGALHFVLMGAGAALFALLVAQFIPQLIPAQAATVKL